MKAIVVHQPWATLIAIGAKSIETRTSPPNGPMRPEGVRGYPGLSVERGERIAICAGAKPAPQGLRLGADTQLTTAEYLVESGRLFELCNEEAWPLPLGVLLCTAALVDAVPFTTDPLGSGGHQPKAHITNYAHEGDLPYQQGGLWLIGQSINEGTPTRIEDQAPFGDFTPGRWGWLLAGVDVCAPRPVKGEQGVFDLERAFR